MARLPNTAQSSIWLQHTLIAVLVPHSSSPLCRRTAPRPKSSLRCCWAAPLGASQRWETRLSPSLAFRLPLHMPSASLPQRERLGRQWVELRAACTRAVGPGQLAKPWPVCAPAGRQLCILPSASGSTAARDASPSGAPLLSTNLELLLCRPALSRHCCMLAVRSQGAPAVRPRSVPLGADAQLPLHRVCAEGWQRAAG